MRPSSVARKRVYGYLSCCNSRRYASPTWGSVSFGFALSRKAVPVTDAAWHGRFGVHVHSCRSTEQALARRNERPRADRGRDPAHGRACRCCIAVCVFPWEQRARWELCICRAPGTRLRRSLCCCTATEVHVEAQAERLQMNWLANCNTYFIFHKFCISFYSVWLRPTNFPVCQGRWESLLLSCQV